MFEGIDSGGHMFEGYREANTSKVSLRDRLQNMAGRPFSLEETFTILGQLGQALCYAHQCNVTHGNLKPETILFNEKGEVLLAEFFLHALATQPDNATVPEASAYRAPELLPGHASKEGDQYALGCIAYEMLTGHKPFLVASVSKPGTFYRTITLISPKHSNPALSSRSEEAILKAIAKEPAQRHHDISRFLTTLGIPAAPGKQATRIEDVPVSLVSDSPEQADAHQAPTWYAAQESEPTPTLSTSAPAQTIHPAQISTPDETEDTTSMDIFKPYTLVDSISHSPDHYPLTRHLLADAIARNSEISMQTAAYAGPLSTNSAKFFLKWRWIGVMVTGLVAICIIAMSILALSISRLTQENKKIPTIVTPSSTVATTTTHTLAAPTLTSKVTPTPEQSPAIAPLPIPTTTATVQPIPTPTLRHGHHES